MAELRVGAKLESLSAIGAFVIDAAKQAGIPDPAAYRLRLAVDELATNVIVHGRPGDHGASEEIRLTAEIDDAALTIALEDSGPEFDPLGHAVPEEEFDMPMEDRTIGGLGVFLAIKGVDEFRYERNGDTNRNIFVVARNGVRERSS